MEEVVSLNKDIATETFDRLYVIYKKFKENHSDENYEKFTKEFDQAIKVFHRPMEERINELLESAGYDFSNLTGFGGFHVKLRMDMEAIRLYRLISLCFDENTRYWKIKDEQYN